jgi:hydroxypyruvate isomerase
VLGLSAHLSTLYHHLPFVDRVRAAADDGFRCVEFWTTDSPRALEEAIRRHALAVSVINVDGGPEPRDAGGLSDPGQSRQWRGRFLETLQLARDLGCLGINVPAGRGGAATTRQQALGMAAENLGWALDEASGEDVLVLLEPLSPVDRPGYLLPTFEDAEALHRSLGAPEQLKIQFDAYHLHQSSGDVASLFQRSAHLVGHVQVADYPGRGAPGSGEIDFTRFFQAVAESGYPGWVGLEYVAGVETRPGFAWMDALRDLVEENAVRPPSVSQ